MNRFSRFLPLVLGVCAWLAFVLPVFDPAASLYNRDTGRRYYPVKHYIAGRLLQGELPLWDPWTESGSSILGQTTPGLFHPFTLLYLVMPFDLAFKLNHLLLLLMAGVSAWLLARRLGASRWAALAAGAAYAGSGYMVSQTASNLPFATGPATVPLAIFLFLRFLDVPSPGRLFSAGFVLGTCALGGEPQSMLFAGLIGAGYAVSRELAGASGGRRPARAAKVALQAAAWGAAAFLLAAPATFPSVAELLRSSRISGPTREQKSFFVPPARFSGLLVPKAFDDVPEELGPLSGRGYGSNSYQEYVAFESSAFSDSIFLGPAALLLAGWALLAGRRGYFLLLGALVFLLGAGGPAFGVDGALQALIPGMRFFRFAEKLIAPASLLLAICAALGADAAFSSRRRAALLAGQSALLACVLLGGTVLLASSRGPFEGWLVEHGRQHIAAAAPAFAQLLRDGLRVTALLAAALAAVAAASAVRPPLLRAGPGLAALACLAAPFAATAGLLHLAPSELLHQRPVLAEELLQIAGPSPGRWRLFVDPHAAGKIPVLDERLGSIMVTRMMLQPQFDALFGIEGAAPYTSSPDEDYQAGLYSSMAKAMQILRVRFSVLAPWLLSDREATRYGYRFVKPGLWLGDWGMQPGASLLGHVEVAAGRSAALVRLQERSFEPRRDAILLAGPGARPLDAGGFRPGQSSLAKRDLGPERVLFDVDVPHEAFLVTSTHFDPGWRATVDGAPAAVLRADLMVNGLFIPPGKHHVELHFWPVGLTSGLVACALAAAALIALQNRRAR